MTAKSWVETTLPPGYVGYDADFVSMYGFCTGEHSHDGFTAPSDRNRAAWRHWTASVLRGRGDVRAKDYGASGGVVWEESGKDYSVRSARCGYPLITKEVYDSSWVARCFVVRAQSKDVDEAMARFAALVLATEGPR